MTLDIVTSSRYVNVKGNYKNNEIECISIPAEEKEDNVIKGRIENERKNRKFRINEKTRE